MSSLPNKSLFIVEKHVEDLSQPDWLLASDHFRLTEGWRTAGGQAPMRAANERAADLEAAVEVAHQVRYHLNLIRIQRLYRQMPLT